MAARVRTDIWVAAALRQCAASGMGAYVVRRGDGERGMVLLKLVRWREGAAVHSLTRDPGGRLIWLKGEMAADADAEARIAREIGRDPDLWVIEVESRDGSHPFDASLLS